MAHCRTDLYCHVSDEWTAISTGQQCTAIQGACKNLIITSVNDTVVYMSLLQGLVVATPLTNDGGKLSQRMVGEAVAGDTECSEPCDAEGGKCVEGECVCNEGRTGVDCSKGS